MPIGIKLPGFDPKPDDPCVCRSGKVFSDCCGTTAPNRRPPPGVLVIEGFLDRAICQKWVDYLEQQPRAAAQVLDKKASTAEKPVFVEDKARVCHEVKGGALQETLNAVVRDAYLKFAQMTGQTIEWMEMPHILRYEHGGFYASHADSAEWDEKTGDWYKVNDRDLSLLLYINDDFTGGGLSFTRFNCRYNPKVGDLLIFPSDHRYEHRAHEVESGFRYAVVSSAAIRGVQRILPNPPDHAIHF